MTRNNWVQKFPSEIYSTLFRFEKEDIMCLIDAFDVPYFLSFESRHSTNWLEWEILTETLSILFSLVLKLFIFCCEDYLFHAAGVIFQLNSI